MKFNDISLHIHTILFGLLSRRAFTFFFILINFPIMMIFADIHKKKAWYLMADRFQALLIFSGFASPSFTDAKVPQ